MDTDMDGKFCIHGNAVFFLWYLQRVRIAGKALY